MKTTVLSKPTDEELIVAYAQRGDERAIRTLVERHQDRVFGYLLGMVKDRSTADDLFQETFLRVLKALQGNRASYTTQGRFLGWVLRIARNAALDHLRTRKRWQDVEANSDPDGLSYWDQLTDDAPPIDQGIDLSEQREWLRNTIDKLPPEQREVLLLRHDAELTFREIAALTDVSINTALGRMRYALLNLRRMMPADAEGIRNQA
ncbi:MAG: RNA polymerase sigma-70 factor (ECF subfamily) [Rhodothermales bacterium]